MDFELFIFGFLETKLQQNCRSCILCVQKNFQRTIKFLKSFKNASFYRTWEKIYQTVGGNFSAGCQKCILGVHGKFNSKNNLWEIFCDKYFFLGISVKNLQPVVEPFEASLWRLHYPCQDNFYYALLFLAEKHCF